ncbi:helix-turn-helix domain-containing protein [Rhodovibrionaceae bacterium A322]
MKDAQLVAQLGRRLRAVRKKGQLTLEQLAESSNVSRSMLSQIERGEANPTFATLWNLTRALGIDLAELVEDATEEERSAIELFPAAQIPKIDNGASGCHLSILSPPNMAGQMEWYELTMEPKGQLDSLPHALGTLEHLTLMEGQAELTSGTDKSLLGPGDTARYRADQPHCIRNSGDVPLKAFLVVMGSGG